LTLRGSRGYRCGDSLRDLSVISDGALLVRDGVVLEAGPSRRVENLAVSRGAIEISASGRVVMPGFVDSHTHLLFPPAGARGADAAGNSVRTLTGQRIASRLRPWITAMARHGATTVEAGTGSGADESAETKLLRVATSLDGYPLGVVPIFRLKAPRTGAAAAIDWAIDEFLPAVKRRRLARFAEIFWDPEAEEAGNFVRFLSAARNLGIPCRIDASPGMAGEAIRHGVANLAVSVAHCEGATAADIACMAGAGTMVIASPAAWLEGGELPPVRQLIDANAPIALATDFAPHMQRSISMQMVVGLAVRLMGITIEEAISAATVNGAHALGLGSTLGTLEPGRAADLLVLNISDYRDLASHFGANLVALTMKGGEFISQQGPVEPLNPEIVRVSW
jgi:imidazolonepropionase